MDVPQTDSDNEMLMRHLSPKSGYPFSLQFWFCDLFYFCFVLFFVTDAESLFVVFCTNPAMHYAGGFMTCHSYVPQVRTDSLGATRTGFQNRIKGIIMKKLASFPTTPKLLVTHISMSWMYLNLPESLHVEYVGSESVEGTILEVLSKRWQTLDLISIMKEVQRTLSMQKNSIGTIKKITDNLSAIPTFHQTTVEQS